MDVSSFLKRKKGIKKRKKNDINNDGRREENAKKIV